MRRRQSRSTLEWSEVVGIWAWHSHWHLRPCRWPMYHPRPRHNQEPGALLAQHCGNTVLSTRCNRRLTSLLRGHRYVRFVPKNQLREEDGGRVLVVFTLVVQRWFGLSTTSGSQVTLAALASRWEQWQTIIPWSADLLPIFSSLPARGSKQERQARRQTLPLLPIIHPIPDVHPLSMRNRWGKVNSELAQMFPPTAADSESFWQTNRVMNASARSAPTPHPSHPPNCSATRHWGKLLAAPTKNRMSAPHPDASRSPQSSPHLHLAFARERPVRAVHHYGYLDSSVFAVHPQIELIT
ncbi:hypothetical protein JMJ77_0005570 [Colletotrichum scovillei]|uniref:Uncharacterized protein n=1 Tax=Colletotrichum scovillei TaxID=1209932 RepID=A0A9P7RHH1_9PEZI|nr:hypothetical protein JMJ77_0005570 [Colletotrichum scovillei]KAG7076792.1 hypothetical protein JMJ76_0014051 [Colletotrichum scovillei]KAG7083794.1 hypothetical protein JMJ78_0009236 [Colletotrichum scovillei]